MKFRAWDNEIKKMVYFVLELLQNSKDTTKLSPIECYQEIMQFTGLNDKNSKESYEGDIIECKNKSYLIYQCQTGEWRIRNKGDNLSLFNISSKSEVIGNKFETPELLNDKGKLK